MRARAARSSHLLCAVRRTTPRRTSRVIEVGNIKDEAIDDDVKIALLTVLCNFFECEHSLHVSTWCLLMIFASARVPTSCMSRV